MPRAKVDGVELEYRCDGDELAPVLLAVHGLGAQLVSFDEGFVAALVRRGFRVVRYDHRDVGLSTKLDHLPPPDLGRALAQVAAGERAAAPYSLDDLADDAAGLLDALGVDQAHVVGVSMGGMVAQLLAIRHPERVRSLCSIMSTTGAPGVGAPRPEALEVLLRPPPADRAGAIAAAVASARVIGSPGFPFDEDRVAARAAAEYDRCFAPAGVARQLAAILAAGDRTEALRRLRVPTCVIHGRADPLVTPSGGEATAAAVPGARLVMVDGMGHDLPEGAWPAIVEAIAQNAARADPRVASHPAAAKDGSAAAQAR
jgi:pimeloyl-ACP methyl ester carboxylesterase